MRLHLLKRSRLSTTPTSAAEAITKECPHCHILLYWQLPNDDEETVASTTASQDENNDIAPLSVQAEPNAGQTHTSINSAIALGNNSNSKSVSAGASDVIDVVSDAIAQDLEALASSQVLEGLERSPMKPSSNGDQLVAPTAADNMAPTTAVGNIWKVSNNNRKALMKRSEAKKLESLRAANMIERRKLKRRHSRAMDLSSIDGKNSTNDGNADHNNSHDVGSRTNNSDDVVVISSSHPSVLTGSVSLSTPSTPAAVQYKMTDLLASNHPGMPEARIAECVYRACAISPTTVLQELHTSLVSARRRQSGFFSYTPLAELHRTTPSGSGWTEKQLSEELRAAWKSAQSISADLFVRVIAHRIRLAEFYRIYQAWQDYGPRKRYSVAKQRAFYLVNPHLPDCGRPSAKSADLAVKSAWTKFDNDLKFAAKMAALEEELGQAAFMMLPSTSFPNEFFRTLPLVELRTWAGMVRQHVWPEEPFVRQAWLVTQQLLRNDLPDQLTVLETKGLPKAGDRLPYTRLLELSDAVYKDTESI